jgi:hypothetical protein
MAESCKWLHQNYSVERKTCTKAESPAGSGRHLWRVCRSLPFLRGKIAFGFGPIHRTKGLEEV